MRAVAAASPRCSGACALSFPQVRGLVSKKKIRFQEDGFGKCVSRLLHRRSQSCLSAVLLIMRVWLAACRLGPDVHHTPNYRYGFPE